MPTALDRLVSCISDVDMWLGQNRLKLNQTKTQFMLAGTRQQISLVKPTSVNLCMTDINFSDSVTNLGCIFDSRLTMGPHVSFIVKDCSFQLRQLR